MRILQRYTSALSARYTSVGLWPNRTFCDLLRQHAVERPHRIALVDGARRLTFGELHDAVTRVACGLATLGLDEEILAVQLPNSIELCLAILATQRVGAAYNALNPLFRRQELETILAVTRPRGIVIPTRWQGFDYPALVRALRPALPELAHVLTVGPDTPEDARDFASLGQEAPRIELDARFPPDPDRVWMLGVTSGTTGTPKIYMHTVNSQLGEALAFNRELGITADDIFLAIAPLTHRGAVMVGFFMALAAGATLVLLDRYEPSRALDLIARERCTCLFAIPTQAWDLLREDARQSRDARSLRLILMSGAPIPADLVAALAERWPSCLPLSGYGLSETGFACYTRPGDPPERLFTCGRPAPGMEICALDEQGRVLPPGVVGELGIRGCQVCAGYFANQEATRAALTKDGWFLSGDLGRVDAEGYVHYVGRRKHVIVRGGYKVYAEELEFLLRQCPGVSDVILVPIPDERLGERTCACLVAAGAAPTLADLCAFLERRGVAKYTWPEYLMLLESLPRNAVGKIDRLAVRDLARQAWQAGRLERAPAVHAAPRA